MFLTQVEIFCITIMFGGAMVGIVHSILCDKKKPKTPQAVSKKSIKMVTKRGVYVD